MYIFAVLVGIAAGTGYGIRCAQIQEDFVNEIKDESSYGIKESSAKNYNNKGDAIGFSCVLVFLALLLWIYQRVIYHKLLEAIEHAERDYEKVSENAIFDRGIGLKSKLLEVQRQAYEEVAAPLEPYILVFIAFGIPQVISATSWCIHNSEEDEAGFSVRDVPCEHYTDLVLSLRSLALVIVFFSNQENRFMVGKIPMLLFRVLGRLCCCTPMIGTRRTVRFSSLSLSSRKTSISSERRSVLHSADRDVMVMGPEALATLITLDDDASLADSDVPYTLMEDIDELS